MIKDIETIITDLKNGNKQYSKKNKHIFKKFIKGQSTKICVLTCSDSRVIPEYIFNKSIGELFVIRVAGNVAIDHSVIKSMEYAIDHLKIKYLIILGHNRCGAVIASEESEDKNEKLFEEIKKSFIIDPNNHSKANIIRQIEMLPNRSKIIKNKKDNNELTLLGVYYNIEDGSIEFL
jgi:carbonic anhydrase